MVAKGKQPDLYSKGIFEIEKRRDNFLEELKLKNSDV